MPPPPSQAQRGAPQTKVKTKKLKNLIFLVLDLVKVQIIVADTNDNAPHFAHPLYRVEVPESVELGKELLQVRAEDPDSHSTLRLFFYLNKVLERI